jgi:UDP-3-O-[3-hydroxymyristoyl] glucosamine N-acyltransferase
MTAKELAARIGGELEGDGSVEIRGIRPIAEARKGDVTFLSNRKYEHHLETTQATALICAPECGVSGLSLIRMKNPYLGFARAMRLFFPRERGAAGIHPAAVVAPTATIGEDACIHPCAVIEDYAAVGDRAEIGPGCVIGRNATVGADSLLHAHVTVYRDCEIGERVIVHSGAVIGGDGFGFATDENGRHVKIPQAGNVVIADDVEIGSNCSIDRAVLGSTRVGKGTKIDNLVQIAHNVEIGERCFIVGQVGISGSSKVGDQSILAGQVGVVGHVSIGDHVVVGAQSGVSNDVSDGEVVLGSPARPIAETKRILAVSSKLPEMRAQLRELLKRIEDLEAPKTG